MSKCDDLGKFVIVAVLGIVLGGMWQWYSMRQCWWFAFSSREGHTCEIHDGRIYIMMESRTR